MSPNEPLPIFLTRRYFCAITNSGGLTRLDIFRPKLSQQCERPIRCYKFNQQLRNLEKFGKKRKRRKRCRRRQENRVYRSQKVEISPHTQTVDQSTNLTMWSSHLVVSRCYTRGGEELAPGWKTSCGRETTGPRFLYSNNYTRNYALDLWCFFN